MASTGNATSAPARDVRCPRCGYDQRGVIETWKDSCPLEGVCSECGLEWRWAVLFTPRLDRQWWFIEHGWRRGSFPFRMAMTCVMMLCPWKFWRDLRLTFEPRRGVMAAYTIVLIVMSLLAIAAAQGSRAAWWWQSHHWAGAPIRSSVERPFYVLHAATMPLSRTSPGTYTRPWGPGPIDLPPPLRFFIDDWRYPLEVWRSYLWFHLLIVGAFVLLPISLRRAKVRPVHLIRVTVYALPYLVMPLLLHGAYVVLMVAAGFKQSLAYHEAAEWVSTTAKWWRTSIPVFEFVWWSLAVSLYLRLRHGWAVGASIVAVAGLAVILIRVLKDIWPAL